MKRSMNHFCICETFRLWLMWSCKKVGNVGEKIIILLSCYKNEECPPSPIWSGGGRRQELGEDSY